MKPTTKVTMAGLAYPVAQFSCVAKLLLLFSSSRKALRLFPCDSSRPHRRHWKILIGDGH